MSDPQNPDDNSKIPGNPDAEDIKQQADQQPPPTQDYADREDAGKGEITVYSLGGVIDEFTTSSFRNLGQLLIIVFAVNPLIIGFMSALKTIWDGVMDPIVAHWSDNCNSRFGRRRPFILAGGLLMALVAWITWQFMPDNPNMRPNDPVVPEVFFSDQDWDAFGDLMLAYGVSDFEVRVEAEDGADGKIDPEMLRMFGEDSIKTLGTETKALVRAEQTDEEAEEAEEDTGPPRPLYTITLRPLQASEKVVGGGGEDKPNVATPFSTELEVALSGPGLEAPVISRVSASTVEGKVNDREREIDVVSKIVYFFIGHPKEDGLIVRNDATEHEFNILEHREGERAVMGALQMGMMDVLSRNFGLPYWRLLPEGAPFSEEAKTQLQQTALTRLRSEPDFLNKMMLSAGVRLNLKDGEMTAEEEESIAKFLSGFKQTEDEFIFNQIYGDLTIEEAASYHAVNRDPLKTGEFKSVWEKIGQGFSALVEGTPQERKFIYFVLAMFLLMAMAQTFYSAAYYAQGIEIAPSYNGRTLVTAYRSVTNGLIGFITTLFLPLSLLPVFASAREGSLVLVYFLAPLGIVLAFLVFFGTKERTVIIRPKTKQKLAGGFFKAVREIGRNPEFWRVTGLYLFMGYAVGTFQGLGSLIGIYYVFDGNMVIGASYGSVGAMLGQAMGMLSIPLFVYLCKWIGKHNTLRLACISLAIGSSIKYWCYNPEIPELMWIPPFFYSPAIAMFYNVLSSMMGDVTDLDELRHGERREGMFGAVMAIIMKSLGAFTAIASGFIIVASGFEVSKGVYQDPGVFHNMLILYSIVPGVCAMGGLLLLWRFKLTEERVVEIKKELAIKRAEKARQEA